jgi:hypothetical protein
LRYFEFGRSWFFSFDDEPSGKVAKIIEKHSYRPKENRNSVPTYMKQLDKEKEWRMNEWRVGNVSITQCEKGKSCNPCTHQRRGQGTLAGNYRTLSFLVFFFFFFSLCTFWAGA